MSLTTARAKSKPYRKVFVYGTHGVGKTTFAWGRERGRPVFIRTEDGTDDIEDDDGNGVEHQYPVAASLEDVENQICELIDEEHDRGRLVIDSADWLEPFIVERMLQKNPIGDGGKRATSIEHHGFGRGHKFLSEEWSKFLRLLDELCEKRKMTVVLLAHCQVKQFSPPDSEPYDRYTPKLSERSSALVQEWADEVFFATHKKAIVKTDVGFNKEHVRGISTGERVLKTTETPAWMAKNRLRLPEEIPLSWDAYANYWEPSQ